MTACAALFAYWMGAEFWLLSTALVLPISLLLRPQPAPTLPHPKDQDAVTGFMVSAGFADTIDHVLKASDGRLLQSACLSVQLDDFHKIRSSHGDAAADEVLRYTARRITAALRSRDLIARVGDARFVIFVDPVASLDLEVCLQLSSRLQTAIEEPIPLHVNSVHLSCSVGFCPASRLGQVTGKSLCMAANLAMQEAQRAGPSSVRAYHDGMRRKAVTRRRSEREAENSIERGEINAWFQPQVSTNTGLVTGFEALARWEHPQRGVIPPVEFLPVLQQSGQLERLAYQMMSQALTALGAWNDAGFIIPTVGVNFASDELSSPALLDKVRWELDRHSFCANRLTVEVLETVVAGAPNDMVVRNVNGLAELGCQIDLDDFGTGHASISSIRRLTVSRLKIDRSFVTRIDQDIDQQRMVSAILTMADRLGLDTLAEGVETPGEHTMLAQLGCGSCSGVRNCPPDAV